MNLLNVVCYHATELAATRPFRRTAGTAVPAVHVGALLFAAAQRRDNDATEERRHREILDAVKRGEK